MMSTVIPFNVLADNPAQSTFQGIDPSKEQTGTIQLTPEQLEALNKITAESEMKISPEINVQSANPVRIIVEFKPLPAEVAVIQQQLLGNEISLTDAKKDVNDSHKKFKAYVQTLEQQEAGVITPLNSTAPSSIQITNEYKHAFNGVSMILPGTDVEKLFESGLVNRIFEDRVVKLDSKELDGSLTNSLPVENMQVTTSPTPIQELSVSEQNTSSESLKENYIPLPGIDDLHKDNVTGAGIKVGVLDTGIDYNHPDLKNVYKGYKKSEGQDPKTIDPNTVKGWDFVDNDADPMETTYQDWVDAGSPVTPGHTFYTYHGSHVSGTIAAQGENTVESPAQGVAPDVDLYSYRVLGPYGSGYTSGIIGGIDKAVSDGMDVINLSLGSPVNDPLVAESVAINNATLAGVTCVISAGNSGPGEKTLGSPGTAAFAITVGASDFPMSIPTISANVGSQAFDNMKLLGRGFGDNLETLANKTYPVIDVGLGGENDFKDSNGQPIDLTGKVALIERGTYALVEKIANARKAGAVAAIMYNNIDGEIDNYLAQDTGLIPTYRLTKADGERLKEAVASSSITFTSVGAITTQGNHLAGFSSRGPVNQNYDIKPDVVGPGVSVYSTYPEYVHSPEDGIDYSSAYARISGTSMASPHVAGIAALILQKHPEYTPFDVKAALMNTADKLSGDYSVVEVGAGLVDVKEAVYSDVSVKVMDKTENQNQNGTLETIEDQTGSIAYGTIYRKENDTNVDSRNVVIKNNGAGSKTFDISYEYSKAKTGVLDAVSNKVEITASSQAITVEAGQSVELTTSIKVPGSAEKGRYEGYVNIVNHANPQESYRVPFAVRVVDKGIEDVGLERPAISTVRWNPPHPFMATPGQSGLRFKLNSPVKTIFMVFYDKDGNKLGSTSPKPQNASTIMPDKYYSTVFSATYYPFVGDPKEEKTDINAPLKTLPEGEYTLKFKTVDEEGKTYEQDHMFIIDNTLPKLTFKDHAPGKVYELKDSDFTNETMNGNTYNSFWIHANLFDEGASKLAPQGITQSSNVLWYYFNQKVFPDGDFPVEDNGDVKFGIEKSDIENGPATVTLFPMDGATNAHLLNGFQPYAFVKEGTPYVLPSYDKEKVYKNDTLTMTLTLNNVEKLMSGTYDVGFYKIFEFLNVKVNPAFQQYAQDHGLNVTVDEAVVKPHPISANSKNSVNVGAHISGDGFTGFSGDVPFLDVQFKLVNDYFDIIWDTMDGEVNTKTFSYTKSGETTPTTITSFNQINTYKIMMTHSFVTSFARLEAFNGNWSKDYSTIGAKVYAQGSNGEKYPGTVMKNGNVFLRDIPLSKDSYNIVIEAPGHLKSIQKVDLGAKTTWGEDVGVIVTKSGSQPMAAAGDVNSDGIIDVLDVKQVAEKFGQTNATTFPIEDLNQDGIVNTTDMNYLVKNLYKKNPDITADPKEMVEGKYATDYFNMLGISTPINTLKNTTKSDKTAVLHWLAAVDATEVKLEQSIDNGATWTAATTGNPVKADSNSAVITGLMANTSYQFRVKVTGGLNVGVSNVVKVTTESSAPVTPPVIPPVTPPVTPPVAPKAPIVNVIDDNDLTITGTADANVTISVIYNSIVVATGKANAEGRYSIQITPQKAGSVLTVSAEDAVGTQSEVTSITVLDRTAPILPKVNTIDDNDTKISGMTEANANIVVKNNGKTIATGNADSKGAFSIKIAKPKAGTVLIVSAIDHSGNVSLTSTVKVLDKTAPNVPKLTSLIVKKGVITITGTAEANSTIFIKNGTKVVATVKVSSKGTFTVKLSKIGKGTKNISLYALDHAGNKSAVVKRVLTIK
jgi:subtilisin family serine protease